MAVICLQETDRFDYSLSKSHQNSLIIQYILGVIWDYSWRINFSPSESQDRKIASWILGSDQKWLETALELLMKGVDINSIILNSPSIQKYGGFFTPLATHCENRLFVVKNRFLEFITLKFDYQTDTASFVINKAY